MLGKSTRKWEHFILSNLKGHRRVESRKCSLISSQNQNSNEFLRERERGKKNKEALNCLPNLRYPWSTIQPNPPRHRSLVWWHHGSSHCSAFGTSEGGGGATFQVATMALLAEEGANAPASKAPASPNKREMRRLYVKVKDGKSM